MLKNSRKNEEAIEKFKKAAKFNKNDPQIFYQIGLCYHNLHRFK
jgi:tetratricopeptide (TPR) repeat protein